MLLLFLGFFLEKEHLQFANWNPLFASSIDLHSSSSLFLTREQSLWGEYILYRSDLIVYSRDLEWIPFGDQIDRLGAEYAHPVDENILLAELRPGQSIDCELVAVKGIGKVHAKFSPVATASYRLLPVITVSQDLSKSRQQELVEMCPMGVFDIEDSREFIIIFWNFVESFAK